MTERDWGSPYLNEIRRRLRTGRITHAQAQEKLRKAGYVECSDDSMRPPGTENQKRVLDALPPEGIGKGATGKELDEQFGMDVAEVSECMRVLGSKGWVVSPAPEQDED